MAMFVMKRLQGEAPVSLFATSTPLRDVRIIFTHCFGLVDL